MTIDELLKEATNPLMYDSLDWEPDDNSPWRRFLIRYLNSKVEATNSILEIGCGTGSMYSFYQTKSNDAIFGVEPSIKLYNKATKINPGFVVQNTTFEDAIFSKKYSAIFSLFVLEHVLDLNSFMKKVNDLLVSNGKFYLVTTDKTSQETPRHDYEIEIHKLDASTNVHKTTRKEGVMYDIVRDWRIIQDSANRIGLTLDKHFEIYPDKELINESNKYGFYKKFPVAHLLIFSHTKSN